MKKILKAYLNRLTNLTSHNRSLLLLRLTEQFLDLNDLDFQNGHPSFSIIESLIARKAKIKLSEAVDSRDSQANDLSNRLKSIYRHDKFITEERGSKDLYVGWPFIKGKLLDETPIRGPLIFFPVELYIENNQWILALRSDESAFLNKSFLLAYAHYNKIDLPEELIETHLDDWEKEPQSFRTSLYQLLKESPVKLNFNQELFINKLEPFHPYKKDEFEEKYKTGELKLFPEAVIGIFPQAGSYLVPDYNFLISQENYNNFEDFFQPQIEEGIENREPDSNTFLNKVKEEQTFTPFSMDASQENSIKAVKKGKSLVVQGPPGSGKSQLISNLISDFIARGKKVLMVCQKRAALDVVYQRLKDEGLGNFVALVHDFKNDRKSIYNQAQEQIEKIHEYKKENNGLDTIYLERMFQQASRKIDQLAEELESFNKALFDTSICGISVKELYLTSDKNKESINLETEFKHFNFNNLNPFLQKLKPYLSYAEKFEAKDYAWKHRVSFKDFKIADFNAIRPLFESIPLFQKEIFTLTEKSLGTGLTLQACESFLEKDSSLRAFLELSKDEEIFEIFKIIYDLPRESKTWFDHQQKQLLLCYEGEGPERTIESSLLASFMLALQNEEKAASSIFGSIKWSLFSKEKKWINEVLRRNQLKENTSGKLRLKEKLKNRVKLESQLAQLSQEKWVKYLPQEKTESNFHRWIDKYNEAFSLQDLYHSFSSFLNFDVKSTSREELKRKIEQSITYCKKADLKKNEWQIYLTLSQIEVILNNEIYSQHLLNSLNEDFDMLCEYDNIRSHFSTIESIVAQKLVNHKSYWKADELIDVFLNSLKLVWIDQIEQKYPILRTASTLKLRQLEDELQSNVKEKLKLSKDILLLKLREQTYKEIEVNRLNNITTYRELGHQVTKKRMIWPIRKLVANFSEELFNLIPCWMASPEAVSAIFPMQSYFDLVIFDEASQCYAENGIPSIYRGMQVVITGDDKQLSPSDIYKSRWGGEDDEIPETQIDSLLDLGSRYLMQTQLTGHYRSKTLELIDFSNHYFYKGKLSLLPSFKDVNSGSSAISFIKVEGIWEKNSNFIEASKVVEEVFSLLQENITEIGVVTFNFQQLTLIQNLLEAESISRKIALPDSIFVKNIENVQGDERDVIIFSIGYAPDINGKLSMNFGSLNAQGGENRLNVAITRAREKIIVVCSILPQQMKVEDAKHEGPKLFKKYLQYALEVSEGKHQKLWDNSNSLPYNWLLKNKLVQELEANGAEKLIANALPFSDLALVEGEKFKAIILTDDEHYYQSPSVKDFHVYNKLTLRNKGWKIKDFYSREFWNNKESVIEAYEKFKERL